MAANDPVIEVPDESLVTIDVSDNPELIESESEKKATETPGIAAKAEPEKKVAAPVLPDTQVVTDPSEALKAAVKTAEEARRAAEAQAIAERQRADEARSLAERRGQEVNAALEQAQDRELAIITNGIDSANRELAAYQDEHSRALEGGEFKKASELQVKMSKAAAALDRLEDAKANFEARKTAAPTTEGKVTADTEATVARTPFERYLVSNNFSPRAESWLRAHPDCAPAQVGGNSAKHAAMMAGHYDALAKGLTEGSDEYFQTIEEKAGYRTPVVTTPAVKDPEPEPQPKPKAKAQPSAPVSRDAPDASGKVVSRDVRLNKDQQEAALLSWPQQQGEADDAWRKRAFGKYARAYVELSAEGKLGRTYV